MDASGIVSVGLLSVEVKNNVKVCLYSTFALSPHQWLLGSPFTALPLVSRRGGRVQASFILIPHQFSVQIYDAGVLVIYEYTSC